MCYEIYNKYHKSAMKIETLTNISLPHYIKTTLVSETVCGNINFYHKLIV